MTKFWQSQHAILIPVILFVILGIVYSMTVPLWESPDELAHFKYVEHLVKTRSLPVQQVGTLDAAHHPPLYYSVAAIVSCVADFDDPTGAYQPNPLFVWGGEGVEHNAALHHTAETFPYRGIALAVHLARWTSVMTGAITVALTYAIARRIFPQQPGLALLASTMVAFNPQFLFISSSVNNDGMTAMTCTLTLWQLTRAIEKPSQWQRWGMVGIFCGLAVLSKPSTFTIGLTAGVLLLSIAISQRAWRIFWRGAPAMGIAFLLVTGWWFVRNLELYGDLLGWQPVLKNWAMARRYGVVTWNVVRDFFSIQFQSYWARFGWMTISAPKKVYHLLLLGCSFSLAGLGRWLWRRQWQMMEKPGLLNLITLIIFPLMQELFMFRSIFIFNGAWYQGRYLFPSIAAISILLGAGLWHLTSQQIVRNTLTMVGIGLLFGAAVFMPFGVIRPSYKTPTLAKWQTWRLSHPSNVTFGDQIRLLGHRIERKKSLDDSQLTLLTLYWQAIQHPELNYSVFVHLIDDTGQLLTQEDAGLGSDQNYPTSAWWVGDIVSSQHTLPSIDSTSNNYDIRIGIYFWVDGTRLPAVRNGKPIGDSVTLDPY